MDLPWSTWCPIKFFITEASYFNTAIALSASPEEVSHVVDATHPYLLTYAEGLSFYKVQDSEYSITLQFKICKLFVFEAELLLPGEPNYKEDSAGCIPYQLLWPTCILSAPATPVCLIPSLAKLTVSVVPLPVIPDLSLPEFAQSYAPITSSAACAQADPFLENVEVEIPKRASASALLASAASLTPTTKYAFENVGLDEDSSSDNDISLPPPPKKLKTSVSKASAPPFHVYHPLTTVPASSSTSKGKRPAVTLLSPIVDLATSSTCSKGHVSMWTKKPSAHSASVHGTADPSIPTKVVQGNVAKSLAALQTHKSSKPVAEDVVAEQPLPSKSLKASMTKVPTEVVFSNALTDRQPITSGSGHIPTPPHHNVVNNTIYACMFDLQINLHSHKPTS
ncbi:hypothetical protein F5146DRAFT_997593 [Armillaria mellea]|nr:hypothetical protein F5146DRAFT_997593 [Armillaria mellea]